ncbi:MAG TPA: hypothetical protein VGR69_00275 [Candidatus Rubrimentiphilum sp.]|nr:hypothetical protein [Candidatus Rubrimentiphilum sp.]
MNAAHAVIPSEARNREVRAAAFFICALAVTACSGNYSTGTQPNPIPPANATPAVATNASATPGAKTATAKQTSPGNAVYPLADASNGFACPDTTEGFACVLRFNVKGTASPSPSPQSPGPQPSSSESPSPAPTGSAPPSITLHATALPKDAPRMLHPPGNALDVIALMTVALSTSADFPLDGAAIAQFTLPKEQIGGRGFALQLFVQRVQGKTKSFAPVLSLDKASLQKNVLTFGFIPPKITVAKNTTYILALYATDLAKSTPPPASASPKP